MPDSPPGVEALLARARADYAARLPAKVGDVEQLLLARAWDEARRAAHKLRGSAATYGFEALGRVVAAIEDELLAAGGAPGEAAAARVLTLAGSARSEAERAAAAARGSQGP